MSGPEKNADSTQEIPEEGNKIKSPKVSYFEPIVSMIFAIVCVVIFLAFPQIIAIGILGDPPRLIPTFDASVVRSLWFPVVLWGLFHIGTDIAYLVERRYTKRLAMITVAGHVLSLICACIILIPTRIINGEYLIWVDILSNSVARWFANILTRPNLIILFIMIIVSIIIVMGVIIRSNKAQKKADEENKEEA